MKIKFLTIFILSIFLLTSCNTGNRDVTDNTEADSALTDSGQRAAETQTDEKETFAVFNTEPGIVLKSAVTAANEDFSGNDDSQTDQYGFRYSLETYFDDSFEKSHDYYDSIYSAFCLVKVTGVRNDDVTEKRTVSTADLPDDITVIEQKVQIEIKRILASTDNIKEKGLIKENDTVEGVSIFTVYLNKEGEMPFPVNFCFPVIEVGAEYIVFIQNKYTNENTGNLLGFLTVPLGSEVIDNDYLNVYSKNYNVTILNYNIAVKYINRFLFDGISDPRVPEKLKEIE